MWSTKKKDRRIESNKMSVLLKFVRMDINHNMHLKIALNEIETTKK